MSSGLNYMKIKLFDYQKNILDQTKNLSKVAYYLDMGLGKTFVGSEKLKSFDNNINLIICQKSKIKDWIEHFNKFYNFDTYDLTNKKEFKEFTNDVKQPYDTLNNYAPIIGIVNYELAWRRQEIANLSNFTLMLDESSIIQNKKTHQTKFIIKLNFKNLILLSGTPCSGKYEDLWTQLNLLGLQQNEWDYKHHYCNWVKIEMGKFKFDVINKSNPYKNVDELKNNFKQLGAIFKKSNEVIDLPKQNFININIEQSTKYKHFIKNDYVKLNELELVGDTRMAKIMCLRQLCGMYSDFKLQAFKDLLQSTEDRLIVFYNFQNECDILSSMCKDRPISIINGKIKNLDNYEKYNNSVTLIQYQAGSMGLNLQKANKIIYFTLPYSSSNFEQSKKRIHRIGQDKTCFYYVMIVKDSFEQQVYETLKQRKNWSDKLFQI